MVSPSTNPEAMTFANATREQLYEAASHVNCEYLRGRDAVGRFTKAYPAQAMSTLLIATLVDKTGILGPSAGSNLVRGAAYGYQLLWRLTKLNPGQFTLPDEGEARTCFEAYQKTYAPEEGVVEKLDVLGGWSRAANSLLGVNVVEEFTTINEFATDHPAYEAPLGWLGAHSLGRPLDYFRGFLDSGDLYAPLDESPTAPTESAPLMEELVTDRSKFLWLLYGATLAVGHTIRAEEVAAQQEYFDNIEQQLASGAEGSD